MNKIVAIFLIFLLLSAGVAVTFISRINQTTNEAALATGSRAIVLPDIFTVCDVFLTELCENTTTRENVSVSYDIMTAILQPYPQSQLTTYYESLEHISSETQLLPRKDTASHLIVAIGREYGVSFRVLVALSSAIGSDPLRKADADMRRPFGKHASSDGFALQMREVAAELASLQDRNVESLSVGGRMYVIDPKASSGTRAVIQYLAAHLTNPEEFERLTLLQHESVPTNLHFIQKNILMRTVSR